MKQINFTALVLFTLLLSSCAKQTIIDQPIRFDQERKELTLEYLKNRYEMVQEEPTIVPRMVVVHFTVIPTMEKTMAAFNPSKLPNWRDGIAGASALNVSSQFLIDQDGTIYRLMPENYMARHVIGLNHCAIGIENVGGTDDLPLTEAQLKANIWLIKYLKKKYEIDYVIGHSEYTLFEGHELWKEVDDGYRTKKTDPGEQFMIDIRKAIKGLGLNALPATKGN